MWFQELNMELTLYADTHVADLAQCGQLQSSLGHLHRNTFPKKDTLRV